MTETTIPTREQMVCIRDLRDKTDRVLTLAEYRDVMESVGWDTNAALAVVRERVDGAHTDHETERVRQARGLHAWSARMGVLAELDDVRAELEQARDRAERLGRRCGARFAETEETRAEAAQYRDERDAARAEADTLREQVQQLTEERDEATRWRDEFYMALVALRGQVIHMHGMVSAHTDVIAQFNAAKGPCGDATPAAEATPDDLMHGWTQHGYPCCGAADPGMRPDLTAKCGGPGLCPDCLHDAAEFHAVPAPSDPAPVDLRQIALGSLTLAPRARLNDPAVQRCTAQYERPGGRERGDRIVQCHLEVEHPGEHEEAGTGVTWHDPAPDSAGQADHG